MLFLWWIIQNAATATVVAKSKSFLMNDDVHENLTTMTSMTILRAIHNQVCKSNVKATNSSPHNPLTVLLPSAMQR